jgi:putative transposase
MAIVEEVLKVVNLGKRQRQFLKLLIKLWLAIPGRINYANLARFSGKNEKTFQNWFRRPLDFISVNSCLVKVLQEEQRLGKRFILGVDASFINKSGKATPELGKYWDSKQGKAVKGLEISCCALIDPDMSHPEK